MNDKPQQPVDDSESGEKPRTGQIGFGTISIMIIFFGIITAMCLGAAVIMAVLFFK